jgi:cytochrome c oxidase subunit 1
MIAISSMSAIVWAHHMFTSGMPDSLLAPFLTTTELISIPTGLIFLSALGTIWSGKLRMTVPMLFALGIVFNFLIGGLTGVFLADVPADIQLHDTYFVVAHFHYTILGGGIFGLFAAIYYWFPKITGRKMSERQGKIHFWWMFVGFNLTFLPMFTVGLQGMNRRIADYLPDLEATNRIVSIAGFFLGASFLVFLWNFVMSWRRGERASSNPWEARTLEWQTDSPPPRENFEIEPVVVGDPYGYGEPGSVHAVFEGAEIGAEEGSS